MKSKLPSVFNAMTASYKAYWFISILEYINREDLTEIPIKNLCARMLVNAWYPVHFFKLNFGLQDLISKHNLSLKKHLQLEADISKDELLNILLTSQDPYVNRLILHFQKNVTYRFLSPWIKYTTDVQVAQKSLNYPNDAPYSIHKEKNIIIINPTWATYLTENYSILNDYGYWKLAQYIQIKNPGVPDIINKLIKPASRGSLTSQRNYWNIVFDQVNSIDCIYTKTELNSSNYAVEHFIPWSFTAHNLIWNLIPANPSINSSKSNKLPSTDFIPYFADIQKCGLNIIYNKKPNHKLLNDYAVFGISISELIALDNLKFQELYINLLSPQLQLAKQLGFENWNYHL